MSDIDWKSLAIAEERERLTLAARVKELEAERDALKRTEKFLRYYECCDSAVTKMTEAVLKKVEDTPMEGDVENLVMNLDQYRKQRDEARASVAQMKPIVEAAIEWHGHVTTDPTLLAHDRALRDVVDAELEAKENA